MTRISDTGFEGGTADTPGGLRQGRFSTGILAESDARRAYRDWLDGILDTEFLAPFTAELDAFRLEQFSVLRLTASARRSIRTAARIAYDRYDSVGVQYVLAGRATGDANGRAVASEPGGVMVLDYGQPFTVTDLEPRTVINIAVSRAAFPAARTPPATLHGAVLTGASAQPLAAFLHSLAASLDTLPASTGPVLARVFADLLVVALSDLDVHKPNDRDEQAIQRAERLVDEHIGAPHLDPGWLAGRLNLSRAEIYTVFDRFGGVARFIMARRLGAARAALENPADTRRIGAIAYALGFSSEAYFSRAFRTAFGITATQARRAPRTQSQK